MRKINNDGFSLFEGVLFIVVLVGIGFIGWYAYHNNKQNRDSSATITQTKAVTPASTSRSYQTPVGYKEYTNTDVGVTFAYPTEWPDLKLTTTDYSSADWKDTGAAGKTLVGQSGDYSTVETSKLRFLATTADFKPAATDETLITYTRSGYTHSGSTYMIADGSDASKEASFQVVKTQTGEAIVFKVLATDNKTMVSIGIVNLPTSKSYTSIGFLTNNLDVLKTILSTLKVN